MKKKALEITKKCSIVWQNVEYLKGITDSKDSDIARALGRSPQTVSNRRSHPRNTTLEDVVKLGEYFGVSPESLLIPFAPAQVKTIEETMENENE